jgi:hypothetical protein
MSEQHQNDELVGMGVKYPTPIKAPTERVWAIMVDKMYNTTKYLPVTDVKTKDIVPGKEMYREMTFDGKVLKENIHFDESTCEIRCDMIDEDAVHINKYYADTGIIEYWQENKKGDRIPWPVPKAPVLKAMKQTKELAEGSD